MNPHTIHVPSRDLHKWWPFVRRGLDAVKAKTHPEWLPEDIYASIRADGAILLMAMCGPNAVGFTISYFNDLPFSFRKEMVVWVAWTIPPRERGILPVEDAVRDNFDNLYRLAQGAGCFRMSCLSPRPGFAKWAGKFGFKPYLATYERLI